jgi:cobyrinic acid a,c-diamide synthase
VVIAAPASGSGKTVFTLGLLRALRRAGHRVGAAKVGPDYIDPTFHRAAAGCDSLNLDSWAMRPGTLARRLGRLARDAEVIVCEGVMGLFDGAETGDTAGGTRDGSTADIAQLTGWPVVLVVDISGQAASAAAAIDGFRRHRPGVDVAGVVFNKVASERHRRLTERACLAAMPDLPLLGWLPRHPAFALESRHLGLIPAMETPELEARIETLADLVEETVAVDSLIGLARPSNLKAATGAIGLPPLGQRIAVAADAAFAFAYPAQLDDWRERGAEIRLFSPLADESPAPGCDAVFLPGGYPELHAGRLAGNSRFLDGLRRRAAEGAWVYGECGGYMVLGDGLVDGGGARHAMAGLLPVSTSFADRRLHLGYRRVVQTCETPFGKSGTVLRGHEFHYATTLAAAGDPLFQADSVSGHTSGLPGIVVGRVFGSFIHVIDAELS